jgi:hypothetical protein
LLEAGIKNIGDAAKTNLLEMLEPALKGIAGYFSEQGTIAQAGLAFDNLVSSMEASFVPTTALRQEFYKLTGPNGVLDVSKMSEFNALIEYYSNQVKIAEEGTQGWADANYDSAEGMAAAQAAADSMTVAVLDAAEAQTAVADATNDADAAMRSYSEALLFKIASEGLSQKAAYNLAIAMGLVDQNTVAATKQVNVYQDLLESGAITQAQYNLLIRDLAEDIENLPEGKTLEIDDNVDDVLAHLKELETWKSKPIPVRLVVDDSAVRGYSPPGKTGVVTYLPSVGATHAVGGAVYEGNPYTWQEYGYKGELFVPSSDGFIMSRADAERALSKALTNGTGGIDPEAIGKAVAQAMSKVMSNKNNGNGNVYNLTMPTSSNPADVKMAFELMEAWA